MNYMIREMRIDDITQVVAIDRECFPPDWTSPPYRKDLESNAMAHYLVACDAGAQVAGVIGLWMMADEAHIVTMAVRPARQRQGVGESLLVAAIDMAIELNARMMTLEVRRSNTAAIALYRKYGFAEVGSRRAYYGTSREDAVIMSTPDPASVDFRDILRRRKSQPA